MQELVFSRLRGNQLRGMIPEFTVSFMILFHVSGNKLSSNISTCSNNSFTKPPLLSINDFFDSSQAQVTFAALYSSLFMCGLGEAIQILPLYPISLCVVFGEAIQSLPFYLRV